jgi:squalene-hopene/tetraprenyl-beta-curcumene cyclase
MHTGLRTAALLLGILCSGGLSMAANLPATPGSNQWSPQKAAAYLDQRITWWMAWPGSARSQETFCISCHTALPYALARPALHRMLGEGGPSAEENRLWNNVLTRVRLWDQVDPYYTDRGSGPSKTRESRGTESVLNALILASHDAQTGRLTTDTMTAFDHMWSLQRTSIDSHGPWWWLQFDNEPFEARDSQYYGAALAAVAVGTAPKNYRSTPRIQKHLQLLREYLIRGFDSQSPINQVALLWASTTWPGLLPSKLQREIIRDIISRQQADGGWNMASLAWSWRDWSWRSLFRIFISSEAHSANGISDGYATALIAFVLEQVPAPGGETALSRAISWLVHNQDRMKGFWSSSSLNHRTIANSPTALFMSDAATAYATLALSPPGHTN